jgi:hypothetical protein
VQDGSIQADMWASPHAKRSIRRLPVRILPQADHWFREGATLGLHSSSSDGGSSTDARRGEFGQLLGPLFFDTVESKSSESPVAGKIEKGVSRFVDLGFRGPLDACAGKLPIFAGCDHGGTSSAEISPTLKTTLPRSAPTVPKGTQVSGL